jgi:hypothetical protein
MGAVINEPERRGGVGKAAASYSEDREFISGDQLSLGLLWVSSDLPCTYRDNTLNMPWPPFPTPFPIHYKTKPGWSSRCSEQVTR